MKPVDQDLFGVGVGNCFAACVASILELPLAEVPNFCCDYPENEWYQVFANWLNARGCMPLCFPVGRSDQAGWLKIARDCGTGVPWIGSGDNPDGAKHSTVWMADKMVHDPNPSRRGIIEIEDALFIVSARPGWR